MAAVVVALAAAACTATTEGAPAADPAPVPAEGPGSDPVAWTDRVCGALLSFTGPARAAPDYATAADLPAVQREVSSYLADLLTGVRQGRAQLDVVGRAPEPAGDGVVARAEAELEAFERDVAAAKATVDTADPAAPDAFLAALAGAESALAAVRAPDPLGGLDGAPRLQRAAERAGQCRQLSAAAIGGSR